MAATDQHSNGAADESQSEAASGLASDLAAGEETAWRPKAIEMLAVFTVWALYTALSVGGFILDSDRAGAPATTDRILWRVAFFMSWAIVTPGIFWLAEYLGAGGHLKPWQRISLHVVAAVGVSVGIDVQSDIVRNYVLQFGPHVVDSLAASVQLSMQEAKALGFTYELIIYMMILAVGFARAYYRRLQERRVQATELRAQLTEARLQALRMQINPHFLFNTLNAVSGLVERNPKGVRTMVARLSALLRHTLSRDGSEGAQEVTLDQELDVLDDYLEIMHVRFGDRLQVERAVDEEVRDALVPDLILQPIVENAIKHGVSPQEDGGRVRIGARRISQYLRLSVEDDGPGMADDGLPEVSDGIGLRNVKERLQRLYGDDQRMNVRPGADGGLVVEMWIPYRTAGTGTPARPDPAPNETASAEGGERV
jgi:two-component sensor histidine kinase